jgi:hypothetical protein
MMQVTGWTVRAAALCAAASAATALAVVPAATANAATTRTATAATTRATTASASPAATPGYVEGNVANPITALPPVSRPDTRHCTVTVMRHDFANSYGKPFVGTVTPPKACPGPWAKVVLDWNGSVKGRQYDRLAGVWLGGAEILRTSTPEPDAAGISWHDATDITEFTPLLRGTQPVVVDLGNIVNATYTGIYHMSMTFTYYQADRRHPAAAAGTGAQDVIPLSQSTTSAGWYTLNAGQVASKSVTLPRNATNVRLEVYARGGGCDEQWFTSVPNDLAAKFPNLLCGNGPYREVEVSVDGAPAGVTQPYPVVYSGGIVPTMWTPIMAIDSRETLPYDIDLTPFVGRLVDGRPHTITITPWGNNDNWTVDGTLFVTVDRHLARTSGALTKDDVAASPSPTTTETPVAGGGTRVDVAVRRHWETSGYVDTSRGRVWTTVVSNASYTNTDVVSANAQDQTVRQRDAGTVTVSTRGARVAPTLLYQQWSYPIDVDSRIPVLVDDNNFQLSATVHQQRELDTRLIYANGRYQDLGFTDDQVTAQGEMARSKGVTTEADGSDSEHFVGLVPGIGCYDRLVAADHGQVTTDRREPCEGTDPRG